MFDLWRMYSTVDPYIDAEGQTKLPPPERLIFPHFLFFSDPDPFDRTQETWKRRVRTEVGLHPYLVKAAFPHTDVLYHQDWKDYYKMEVPFVFERMVIADPAAASKAAASGQPTNAGPYELETSAYWWEPIRRTLVSYFDRLQEETLAAVTTEKKGFLRFNTKAKKIITFIDNQEIAGQSGQSVMLQGDYEYFSRSLHKLGREKGYEVHIISSNTTKITWDRKMDTIIRSSVSLSFLLVPPPCLRGPTFQ